MDAISSQNFTNRFADISDQKANGVTYTPKILSDFVAEQILNLAGNLSTKTTLRVLDPAVGDGELLVSLLKLLTKNSNLKVEVYGYETNLEAIEIALTRIKHKFPNVSVHFKPENFIKFVLENFEDNDNRSLFSNITPEKYDLIIANPPYVRTQIMGSSKSKTIAKQFGLSGRVDLYHAFILCIQKVIKPEGIAGIIVSNRFMTTKSGASVRRALIKHSNIHHVWDLGDTKLFNAAVLPAVLLTRMKNNVNKEPPGFTTIYQTTESAQHRAVNPIDALNENGVIKIEDGRHFHVIKGMLDTGGTPDGVWRVSTKTTDDWLLKVDAHTWGTFRDLGKIRVGVKTCADKVFIRSDWQNWKPSLRPELLKRLTTHHIARRYKAKTPKQQRQILYPHEVIQGNRQTVDLKKHPNSEVYLDEHRSLLEGRSYVIAAGRKWYEIWVPQDPDAWAFPKLVFRDISERPTFWIDKDGSVVNGDCYWLVCKNQTQNDLLWLALAVANSTFIERFYDSKFNNKLYAGRRRFITQYVEKFPLPNPKDSLGKDIIFKSKKVYDSMPSPVSDQLIEELNVLVWKAFGFSHQKKSEGSGI